MDFKITRCPLCKNIDNISLVEKKNFLAERLYSIIVLNVDLTFPVYQKRLMEHIMRLWSGMVKDGSSGRF